MDEELPKSEGIEFSIEITTESFGDLRIGAGDIMKVMVSGLAKREYQGKIISIDFSDDDVVKLTAIDEVV